MTERTGTRYAREKQVLRCDQNDNQKSNGNGKNNGKNAGISPLRVRKSANAPVEMTALYQTDGETA